MVIREKSGFGLVVNKREVVIGVVVIREKSGFGLVVNQKEVSYWVRGDQGEVRLWLGGESEIGQLVALW